MHKVLISDKMLDEVVTDLQKNKSLEVVYKPGIDEKELIKHIADAHVLIVRSRTKVTKKVLDAAPLLKIVGRAGVGLDNIDTAYAHTRGVEVLNTPGASSNSVAEHTIGMILAVSRHLAPADASLTAGKWDKKLFMGQEIASKTLGIIGYGRIGSVVAQKATALGMNVVVYEKRKVDKKKHDYKVSRKLSDFLPKLDYLSVHVPLNENTKDLISTKEFSLLKPSCIVINCSRGGIINEAALIKAVTSSQIAGAGVDVFTKEPQFNKKLVSLPNVLATPHIAASTTEAQQRCGFGITEKVVELLSFKEKQDKKQGALPPLAIVPVADIKLHEYFDKKRVGPLAAKIKKDNIFTNPPLVTEVKKKGGKSCYLMLDGSNRTESLKKLGIKYALVQLVDYGEDDVLLKKWNHAISGMKKQTIIRNLLKIQGVQKQPVSVSDARAKMASGAWICAVVIDNKTVYGIKKPVGLKSKLERINKVANIYHNKVRIKRTEADEINEWDEIYESEQVIIVYPELTKKELLESERKKLLFPSGVSRHLIPHRVLGVNMPLGILKSSKSLEEKNAELQSFLKSRLAQGGGLRYYEESLFVFD